MSSRLCLWYVMMVVTLPLVLTELQCNSDSEDSRCTLESKPSVTDEFGFYEYNGNTMSFLFPAPVLDRIKETVFHDDDVIITTYPKCGTIWMQAIVALVHSDAGSFNEILNEQSPLHLKYNFIEAQFPGFQPEFDRWSSSPAPHLIKTHLSADFYHQTLEKRKTKFIVVFRNPKDVLVSYFHFYKMNTSFLFNGTWDEFFQLFKQKILNHGDIFETQLSWWKLRNDPRILIVKYEDMLNSPEAAVQQVMRHLGKSLSDTEIQKIVQITSFKSMKANPKTNYEDILFMRHDISPFMRKGTVGDWKNYFSNEQVEYVDELIAKYFEPVSLLMEDN